MCNNGEFATTKDRKTMQNSVKANGQYWFSDFRELHNERLQIAHFYFWVNTLRRFRREGHVVHTGAGEKHRGN
jgi:hypothetical protein